MNCHNCGVPMMLVRDRDDRVCDSCGAYAFPDASLDGARVLGKPGEVKCPVCQQSLVSAAVETIPVQTSLNCRGVLTKHKALVFIVQALQAKATPVAQSPQLNREELGQVRECPQCG